MNKMHGADNIKISVNSLKESHGSVYIITIISLVALVYRKLNMSMN